MALLTRYFQLKDADGTEVFNFVVTKAVTRDFHRDVVSKEFSYRFHRWAVSFTREDKKTLGIYLVWRSPSDNVHVCVDVAFTILNRENFADSRGFSLPRANFRMGFLSNGNRSFIKIAELMTYRPRFVDTNGEFQVELRISKLETYFERDFFFRRDLADALKEADNASIGGGDGGGGGGGGGGGASQTSGVFQFGTFAFAVTARPRLLVHGAWRSRRSGASSGGDGAGAVGLAVSIARKFRPNSQSLLCRLGFVFSAGVGDKRVQTDVREETLGPQEYTQSWCPSSSLEDLFVRRLRDGGMVRVRIDLHAGHAITEFFTIPFPPHVQADEAAEADLAPSSAAARAARAARLASNNGGSSASASASSSVSSSSAPVHGVDSEVCNWAIEADTHSSFLRFSLVFMDIAKIPRNHLRFVQWRSFLVRRSKRWRGLREEREQLELVDFQSGNLFSRYYFQDESDQGVMMETTLPTKEVKEGINEFLEDSSCCVRVRIQWEFSHQLFQATVHQCDDVVRHHNLQMRLEISNLREKIRQLELQLLRQQEELDEETAEKERRQQVFKGNSTSSSMVAFKDSAESSDSSFGNSGSTADSVADSLSQQQPPPPPHSSHPGLQKSHHRIVKRAILAAQLSLDSQERRRRIHSGGSGGGEGVAPGREAPPSSPYNRRAAPGGAGAGMGAGAGPAPSAAPALLGGLAVPQPSTSLSTGSLHLQRSPTALPKPNSAALQGASALKRANTLGKPSAASSFHGARAGVSTSASVSDIRQPPNSSFEAVSLVNSVPSFQIGKEEIVVGPESGLASSNSNNNNEGEKADRDAGGSGGGHSDGEDGRSTSSAAGRSLWDSPTLRRMFAPLRQSLSVSADNLPRAPSPLPTIALKLSQMSKCQSFD